MKSGNLTKTAPAGRTSTMRHAALLLCMSAALAMAAPVHAHHPGANLDEAMGEKEKYFQPVDGPAPGFELADAEGRPVRLNDFADKIVVLNFVFAGCTDVCPLHSELIARVQEMINITPMKDMVQFLTVTTDPETDTPDILKAYGPVHGLDKQNWMFLTTQSGQPADATRKLAEVYNLRFDPLEDGQQMHGVVTNIIDRNGRLAAKFHGLRFALVNIVSYINDLTNNIERPKREPKKDLWQRVKEWF